MSKNTSGFTIVELLIVIVVVSILAVTAMVAFNGIQQRATNSKTTAALDAWIKAMKLYRIDKGHWPNEGSVRACLGAGYLYGLSGVDPSGTAQCRETGATGWLENTTFNDSIKPYLGNSLPTPSMVTARSTDTDWRRGLSYFFGGGDGTLVYINVAYAGLLTACPSAGGVSSGGSSFFGGNTVCLYTLGTISDT